MGWLWNLFRSAVSWGVPLWFVFGVLSTDRFWFEIGSQFLDSKLWSWFGVFSWHTRGRVVVEPEGVLEKVVFRCLIGLINGCEKLRWAVVWLVRWFFGGVYDDRWLNFVYVVFREEVWGCGFDLGVDFVLVFLCIFFYVFRLYTVHLVCSYCLPIFLEHRLDY